MEVAFLRWPEDAERRATLEEERRPRLLLLPAGELPPEPADCFEDWVVLPVDEQQLASRTRALLARVARHQALEPAVDASGVLRYGDRLLVLPPVEARLAGALASRFGVVVRREALANAGWPDGPPGRNALDVHLVRLRRRLAAVGLTLRTVRSRGYLLEASAADGSIA
ncbi:MAG: two-component system, OmpR family, response regulator [Actinomycetota bacterium]|nr:two-component system, OmpR family, response regulator [Actinomycetota bacterium]